MFIIGSGEVNYDELEGEYCFLVHFSTTFPTIFPYLKGLYNKTRTTEVDKEYGYMEILHKRG